MTLANPIRPQSRRLIEAFGKRLAIVGAKPLTIPAIRALAERHRCRVDPLHELVPVYHDFIEVWTANLQLALVSGDARALEGFQRDLAREVTKARLNRRGPGR